MSEKEFDKGHLSTQPGLISVFDVQKMALLPAYTEATADNFVVSEKLPLETAYHGSNTFYTGWLKTGREISMIGLEPSLAGREEIRLDPSVSLKRVLIEASGEYLVLDLDFLPGSTYNFPGLRRPTDDPKLVMHLSSKLRVFKENQRFAPKFMHIHDLHAARLRLSMRGEIDMKTATIKVDANPIQFKGVQFTSDERKLVPTEQIVENYFADAKIVGYELKAFFSIKKQIA